MIESPDQVTSRRNNSSITEAVSLVAADRSGYETSSERQMRVEALAFAVKAGTYKPDLKRVAERLVYEITREH